MAPWEILAILDRGGKLDPPAQRVTKEDKDSTTPGPGDPLVTEEIQGGEDPWGVGESVGPKENQDRKDDQEKRGRRVKGAIRESEDPEETPVLMATLVQWEILDSLSVTS